MLKCDFMTYIFFVIYFYHIFFRFGRNAEKALTAFIYHAIFKI